MRLLKWFVIALALAPVCLTAGEKPYVWPAVPDKAAVEKARAVFSKTGLVIMERRCDLSVGTFTGVKREEFVRFLVLNEAGAKSASVSVNDHSRTRVEVIEARSIAPDGAITQVDPKKDIHTIELGIYKAKSALASVATVDFPAPMPGAVLDLHFVTRSEGWTFFYADPVTFGQHPALKTDFVIHAFGGFPGTQWSVTLLGGRAGMGRLERKPDQVIEASFGPLLPGKEEPSSVPYTQRDTTLLVYLQWASNDVKVPKDKIGYHFDVDARGRPVGIDWTTAPMKEWWLDYLKKDQEAVKNFLKHPGKAKDVPVDAIAPPTMALEERVDSLYRYVQSTLKYNPETGNDATLSEVVREGERGAWQGTLFFAYLLERAGIPQTRALVADRWQIRFSPVITSSYIYGFTNAVFVEIPGKGRRFYMPGHLSLPSGSLEDGYQDSLALWLADDKHISECFTPLNTPGADRIEYRYEASMAQDGSLTGKLAISKWGTTAEDFVEWHRDREYRFAHPKGEEKKVRMSSGEREQELAKRLREEATVPGTRLDITDVVLGTWPASSSEPLILSCTFTAKSVGQPAQGGTWVISGLPLLAGYECPFTATSRETAVWFQDAGQVVMDGTLALPAAAKIADVPGPWRFSGPDGAALRSDVEAGGKDGAPAIRSHLEFDKPLIVGTDKYAVWKAFEAILVSRAESRCVVSWPSEKVLE